MRPKPSRLKPSCSPTQEAFKKEMRGERAAWSLPKGTAVTARYRYMSICLYICIYRQVHLSIYMQPKPFRLHLRKRSRTRRVVSAPYHTYIYLYVYIHIHVHVYIYILTYIYLSIYMQPKPSRLDIRKR